MRTKRIYHFIALAIVLAGVTIGCQKERPEGMLLVAEGFGSGKAVVEGNHCYWAENDSVRINGVDYEVQIDGMTAYVTGVPGAGTYRALYPNSLNRSSLLTDNIVDVDIPSSYVYRKSGDLQVIDVPMAAIGNGSERLYFQHLTAAVTVEIVNNFGIDITVDSLVLLSDSYQICGSRTITLANPISVPAVASDEASQKRVTVFFNGGATLTVASGDTAQVQVPVLPVGDDNHFTVKVATHNAGDTEMKYTFNRTQTTGGALQRKYIAYAGAKFGGVFSVSADKKVRFAPGNLQYYCSTSTPKWRFAQHQQDVVSFVGSAYGNNTEKWIDLFGFATSGFDNKPPYRSINDERQYYNGDTISKTEYDWGWHNAIVNGGETVHLWRTATRNEWEYVISRSGKFGRGTVFGKKGLFLLPDDFVLPEGCSFTPNTSFSNGVNSYSTLTWPKMETAGVVFLPLTGYRNNQSINDNTSKGYYWTDKIVSSSKASCCEFDMTTTKTINDREIYKGMAVRLVRDVE